LPPANEGRDARGMPRGKLPSTFSALPGSEKVRVCLPGPASAPAAAFQITRSPTRTVRLDDFHGEFGSPVASTVTTFGLSKTRAPGILALWTVHWNWTGLVGGSTWVSFWSTTTNSRNAGPPGRVTVTAVWVVMTFGPSIKGRPIVRSGTKSEPSGSTIRAP